MNILIYFLIIILYSSCAGSHGHIELYQFNENKKTIDSIIAQVIHSDANIKFFPNNYYPYEQVYLKNSSRYKVFTFHFSGDSVVWQRDSSHCQLSLVLVQKVEKLYNYKASQLFFWEEQIAEKEFEEHFINVIRQRLSDR